MKRERRRLLTTWPVITEAMYLLGSSHEAHQSLLAMIAAQKIEVVEIVGEIERISSLMTKCLDTPMDFADASLVAVAERERLDTVFTSMTTFGSTASAGAVSFGWCRREPLLAF